MISLVVGNYNEIIVAQMQMIRPKIERIAIVSAVLFLAGFCVCLLLEGESTKTLLSSIKMTGEIFTAIGFFWFLYDKYFWKNKYFRLWGWLCNMPNLNGRWEGTVCRHHGDEQRPFVMEIAQTFSSLSFRTFSTHSRGESVVASLFVEEVGGKTFSAIAIWRTKTRKLHDLSAEDIFEGTSFWRISIDGNTKKIEDLYYTGREPQTKGTVLLEWKSYKCLNDFKEKQK